MKSTQGATPASARMRRVAIASCVGTTIEFYDFYIYGTAAALVFPKVFFPTLGATSGTVASFATFAVAFIARPVGAVSFGHYGDRIGRKRTLIATLLTAEYAPSGRRGRYAMFPQLGPAIALALASATFLITDLALGNTDQSFFQYGWRIPFLISIVLVAAGLYFG